MKDSFTIDQHITLKEFINFTLYSYVHSRRIKSFFLLILLLDLVALVFGLLTGLTNFNSEVVFNMLTPLILLPVLLVIFAVLVSLLIYTSRPYLFKNVSYDFTHWGIIRNGEKTEFSKPWREITRYKETKSYFIFYIGNADVHFVQKKMFNDANELADFAFFLKDRMSR